tara:strand:- start:10 stop:975 length:966 start_codon:yes stop_codon:yes gene_type:complete
MLENKALLQIIKGNHELKILHHDIEKVIGSTISEEDAIQLFESIGITIRQSGDSYGFRKIDFLNEELIKEKIDQIEDAKNIKLSVEQIIETTSRYFSEEDIEKYQYSLCFADFQTQGRGRGSNQWLSPFGSGICFSVIGSLTSKSSPLGLSIYCGIAIARVLRDLGYSGVSLKWPNDLLHDGKKLGGILIELISQSQDYYSFNIGIGINYDLGPDLNSMDQNLFPPTDLLEINHDLAVCRSEMSGILARTVLEALKTFNQGTMQSSFQLWPDFDALYEKEIKIIQEDNTIKGKNIGIDDTGALLLDQNGFIKKVYNGHLVI